MLAMYLTVYRSISMNISSACLINAMSSIWSSVNDLILQTWDNSHPKWRLAIQPFDDLDFCSQLLQQRNLLKSSIPPSSMHCRVLVGAEEGTLALLEEGGVAWRREEALAAIQGALFVDLPAPSAELEAKQRASAPTLADRFQAELLAAKVPLAIHAPPRVCVDHMSTCR